MENPIASGGCLTISLPCQPIDHNSPLLLLVEDNEANIETVSDYLTCRGFRLVYARDGAEAIEVAKAEQPDLILMDIQMPEMDGLEATRRLRAEATLVKTPIIALTALAMPGDREKCLSVGVTEYITKPVSLKKLVETIDHLLQEIQVSEN